MDPENLKNPCAYLWLYFAYLLFWCFVSICILYSYLYFACVSGPYYLFVSSTLSCIFRLCIRSLYHHSVSLLYCLCVSILYPLSISSPLYSTASACIPTLTLHLNVKSFITAHIIIQYYSADLPPLRPALWWGLGSRFEPGPDRPVAGTPTTRPSFEALTRPPHLLEICPACLYSVFM